MKKSIEQQLRAALPPFIPVTFSPSYVTAPCFGMDIDPVNRTYDFIWN